MNKIINLQRNHGGLVVRVVVCRPYAPGLDPLIFEGFFFPLKLNGLTFADQKLSLSLYSKSTYDSLVWLWFFDLSKLLKKISDWRSFSVLKNLTGYRPYSRSLYYFPSKFPSVLNHTNSIRATSPKFMYHFYQKLNITALQNGLNWCWIRDSWLANLMLCFHCRFSNLSCSVDHSRTNFLKRGRWNRQS